MYQKQKKNLQKNRNVENALIGCGYWGTIIANNLLNLGYKNFYIYDSNLKNSLNLKKKFQHVNISSNYNDILINESIKNVFFATPPSKNFSLIKRALHYKKNIFLEKPGFNKISDFNKIKKLQSNNKTLMFGYIYCFNNYIEYIKSIILKKKLGKLLYIKFQRQNLGPIRNDVHVAEDLSSHDLSIILSIFDKLPKTISHNKYSILKKNISDISNLHMKLDGIYIDINNTWLNPTKIRRITIIGSKKMLLFDEMDLESTIKIYNKYVKYPKIQEFDKKFFKSKALIYEGKNFSPKIKLKSPLEAEIKYFFKCVNKKILPKTDFNFAYKILNFLKKN